MRKFVHIDAASVDEAVSTLEMYGGRASVIAGGTDLLGIMKDRILPEYPEALVNIKTIPGLDFISQSNGMLRIGALTRLADIADHPLLKNRYQALTQAASRAAFPEIRNMGTIGGNICQGIRCWYYRSSDNFFNCLRKGKGKCFAVTGDNRYHSIFGHAQSCFGVNPGDIAPALVVLDATIKTSKRSIAAEQFFASNGVRTTVLDGNEIVLEIQVPEIGKDTRTSFLKSAIRKAVDFPIVNCSVAITSQGGDVSKARICLNAVYNTPYRTEEAENILQGHPIDEQTAAAAGNASVAAAKPMTKNKYKVVIAKTLVKRALLACR